MRLFSSNKIEHNVKLFNFVPKVLIFGIDRGIIKTRKGTGGAENERGDD